MTEEQIVGTREEDKAVYPTLDALFQRASTIGHSQDM